MELSQDVLFGQLAEQRWCMITGRNKLFLMEILSKDFIIQTEIISEQFAVMKVDS